MEMATPHTRRRRPPQGSTVAAAALLLLLLLSSLPPVADGSGASDDGYWDDGSGRALVGKKKKKKAACLRRKYRENRKYLKCAWPLTNKKLLGEPQEENGEDDKKSKKKDKKGKKDEEDEAMERKEERIGACGSNIKQRKRGRCLEGRYTASTADKVVELCRSTNINFPGCKRLSNKFVDYSAGRRIQTSSVEEEKSSEKDNNNKDSNNENSFRSSAVIGRMSIVPWHLPEFNASLVDGYTTCPEFESALEQAFLMLADSYIRKQMQDDNIFRKDILLPVALEAEGPPAEALDDAQEDPAEEEDSFGTNTQEAKVDEADVVKANADFTFAAYGNLILGWNSTTGEILTRTKVEPIEKLESQPNKCFSSNPRATVQSLLMHANWLVAIVETGYSGCWCWYCYYGGPFGDDDESLLSDHAATKLIVYDISKDAIPKPENFILSTSNVTNITKYNLTAMELTLLGEENLQGTLMAARSMGSIGHIITKSEVRHGRFTRHLNRYNKDYEGLNTTAYGDAAKIKAEELAGNYSRKLAEEVLGKGGDCSADGTINIMKISSFGMPSSSEKADEQGGGSTDQFLGQNGLINTFVRVNSFNFSIEVDAGVVEDPLEVAAAGAFMPTSYAEVYASEDYLVLGGQLWSRFGWWPFNEWWDHRTYLLAFRLSGDGSAARGAATGSVPGYTLNQFAFDEYEGYLRVATSSNQRTECAEFVSYNYTSWWDDTIRTHWYCDEWRTLSNSTSQVTVLRLPENDDGGNGTMEFVSNITGLGETETIYAVRFFDDRAFVVTYRLTDPLYSIDFSDPTHPVLADELKIEGFSEYLHPIGNEMLLTVGRDATTEGVVTGMQVALFNVTDLYDISLLTKYTVADAYSEAGREHKAFRYLTLSKLLLIPVRRWGDGNEYDGFKVLGIAPDNITESFDVPMSDDYSLGCYYYANMPPRTLVFKGDGTFIKSHSYQSWDLSEKKQLWRKGLDFFLDENDDCYNYWGGFVRPFMID